ncbi:MAG: hypothetical protein ACFCU2_12945 [Acidimicrobiia bacterium]
MRAESGHAAVELALAVAVLMIPAAVAVLGFGPWSERSVLAGAAAAEAARAAVISLSTATGNQVAAEMSANYGLDQTEMRVGWCGAVPATGGTGTCPMTRGATLEVTVDVWVPLVSTPWGEIGGVWVTRSHAERIDLYRSIG